MRSSLQALRKIESKLEDSLLFGKLSPAKRIELADAIYMSAIRSNTNIDTVLAMIKTRGAFKERFFHVSRGNIFRFVHRDLKSFASKIFHKIAGGGTPNAAMGKGELMLLLFCENTSKPAAGDVALTSNGRTIQIEVKVNSGRLGLGSCKTAHTAVVEYCEKNGIDLPRSRRGKHANGQLRFCPNSSDDKDYLGKARFNEVLGVWWKAISGGNQLTKATWPRVRKEFLRQIAQKNITPEKCLLVMDEVGNFQFFRKPSEFVKFYDHGDATFYHRAHHDKEFSIYLKLEWS